MSDDISVAIKRQEKYRFLVDFGHDIAKPAAGCGASRRRIIQTRNAR